MGNEDDRSSALPEFLDPVHALLLKIGVANRQRLIDHETSGIGMDRNGERQAA